MDYTVKFKGLHTSLGINPGAQFNQGRFIFKQGGMASVNPDNNQVYPDPIGLEVFCHLDEPPEENRQVLEELELALYAAEEIMTQIAAEYQVNCYLDKPITCEYNNKTYVLEESFWEEIDPNVDRGEARSKFTDDLSFLDVNKNFHPMFHLYRVAQDETYTNDYRVLNAWRFLEAYYGLQGRYLLDHLKSTLKGPNVAENFYKSYRNAVAHATRLKNNPEDRSIMVPISQETQFNGNVIIEMSNIMDFLDDLVEGVDDKFYDGAR